MVDRGVAVINDGHLLSLWVSLTQMSLKSVSDQIAQISVNAHKCTPVFFSVICHDIIVSCRSTLAVHRYNCLYIFLLRLLFIPYITYGYIL